MFPLSLLFQKDLCLSERLEVGRSWGTWQERNWVSIWGFTPQMAVIALGWVRPRPQARNSILVSIQVAEAQAYELSFAAFPDTLNRKLDKKWNSWDLNQQSEMVCLHGKQWLNLLKLCHLTSSHLDHFYFKPLRSLELICTLSPFGLPSNYPHCNHCSLHKSNFNVSHFPSEKLQ